MLGVPKVPFRGIQPFRYADHAIFLAREEETEELEDLVAIYRGVLLYGASGDGKSSLINAGLLPAVARRRLRPERIRLQPRAGEEIVVERIATTEDDDEGEHLPSLLAPDGDSSRIVMSVHEFEQRIRETCASSQRPLLIFDQFEELVTLFEEAGAIEVQRAVVAMLVGLLREPLAVKLLFVFREDYLGKIKHLLAAVPELVDQFLRLQPLSVDTLPTIIRGPFERHPGHFARELDPALAERLCAALHERFVSGDVSLSEVETVALRLWQCDDPDALLTRLGVQGLLEGYLSDSLDRLSPDVRGAAIALLAQMVTSGGTRNVVSADDLVHHARKENPELSPTLLAEALDHLERESRLIRRERRRNIHLYEITSEFLVPWIRARREEARLLRERERDELRREQEHSAARQQRRNVALRLIAAALVVVATVIAVLLVVAINQSNEASRQAADSTSLALTSAATPLLHSRPDLSLLLAWAAYRKSPRVEARGSVLDALTAVRASGVVGILHGHSASISSVAFSADRHTIASAGKDQSIRLWDARTSKLLGSPLRGHNAAVNGVAFSPDGRTLASGGDDARVRLWDVRTHRQLGSLRHEDAVYSVAFSADGRTLASAGEDPTVRLWDVRTRRLLGQLRGHEGAVYSVAFSPDEETLASAGADGTVRLWDARTHKPRGSLRGHGFVRSVAFSADGLTLASAGDDHTVRLWDTRTHKPLGALSRGHRSAILSVTFSPDGHTLVTAGDDETVRLWDTSIPPALRGHRGAVNGVAFSPDGRTLASAGEDKTARLWDARTRSPLRSPLRGHDGPVLGVAFSSDGRTLATVDDQTVRLWNAGTQKALGSPVRLDNMSDTAAFSEDGSSLALGRGDGTVRLWDVRTRGSQGTLPGFRGPVTSVALSPGGRTLASAGTDKKIRLWDTRSHRPLGPPLRGHQDYVYGMAFSSDGRMLASVGGDETVRLWDVRTQRPLWQLRGHKGPVVSVAFSADGRTLASGGDDSTIRLWDVRGHRQLGSPLRGHRDSVSAVAFTRDGRTLASASRDGTIRLWDRILWRDRDQLRGEVCRLVGGDLSTSELARYAPGIPYRRSCG